MKFHKSPIALAALAVCGALPAVIPAAAHAAPSISWLAPTSNATLRGTISGSACSVSTSGATRVTFWADNYQINNDYSGPFNCTFDTTRLRDGTYTLRAVAYDAAGASTEARRSITVNNSGTTVSPTPTTSSPTPTTTTTSPTPTTTTATATPAPGSGSLDVWFKSPLSGATISGTRSGSNCYVNGTGATRVQFFLDNTALNTDSTMSDGMQCVLDTTKFANGTHQLKAVAYSSTGATRSDVISVNIQNSATSVSPTPTTSSPTPSTTVPLGGITSPTPTPTTTTATAAPSSGSLDVWFKSPLSGATISGTRSGSNCYVNGSGATRVQFFLDNTALNTDSTMSDGMQCVLDTTKFLNGSHQLKATAYSSTGASRSDVITVNIQNTTTASPTPTSPTPTTISPTPTTTTATTPPPGSGSLDVWFKSPLSGATLSGTRSGSNCYVNGTGVSRVQFFLDNTALNTDSTVSDGMQCVLDTTKFSNGTHQLKATAYSSTGTSRTDVISVNIQNATTVAPTPTTTSPTPTTTSPTPTTTTTTTPPPTSGSLDVWFKSPAAGATISGTRTGTNCYVAGSGVTRVQFFMDDAALNTDSTVSDGMQCVLDTTKFANGTHQLKATAYSSTGASRSDVISVNVQNATTASPTPTTTSPTPTTTSPTPTTTSPTPTVTPTPVTGVSSSLPANGARAVPTFQSIGLYWTPPSNPGSAGCPVVFRKAGDSSWRQGLDMWYDARNNECRGSLVELQPGTAYEVQMGMPGASPTAGLVVNTWNEQFPVAQTITLPAGTVTQPLAITQGGSASGYVVYQADPAGTTIDVNNAYPQAVTISAPYVILRGVTLRGAQSHGIELFRGAHDVVIENNDISNWGRTRGVTGGVQVGTDMDSAIRARCSDQSLERVVIQRNRMHSPRYTANSWSDGHPAGPQGVTFSYCGGNHVIRYNEIVSGNGNYFNDAIGGEDNFTATGFPIADTDINGNLIQGGWDDGIEAEGGNRNVRIWGNYIDQTAIGIASTVVHHGPLYVFKNVYNRSRKLGKTAADSDDRGPFFKAGSLSSYGNGRRYVFHNTSLQTPNPNGTNPLGAGMGISGNTGQPLTNTIIRNNVFHIWKSGWSSIYQTSTGYGNDANYDLYNGGISANAGAEANGIDAGPSYVSGHGYASGAGGNYQLTPGTPGSGSGMRIPNFNDTYGTPDMGAHQGGTPAMKFGVNQ